MLIVSSARNSVMAKSGVSAASPTPTRCNGTPARAACLGGGRPVFAAGIDAIGEHDDGVERIPPERFQHGGNIASQQTRVARGPDIHEIPQVDRRTASGLSRLDIGVAVDEARYKMHSHLSLTDERLATNGRPFGGEHGLDEIQPMRGLAGRASFASSIGDAVPENAPVPQWECWCTRQPNCSLVALLGLGLADQRGGQFGPSGFFNSSAAALTFGS